MNVHSVVLNVLNVLNGRILLIVSGLILVSSAVVSEIKIHYVLTTALDYDTAIEFCKNNDGVHYIESNDHNFNKLIKCKNSAEFRIEEK
jgi:hypothetical protein